MAYIISLSNSLSILNNIHLFNHFSPNQPPLFTKKSPFFPSSGPLPSPWPGASPSWPCWPRRPVSSSPSARGKCNGWSGCRWSPGRRRSEPSVGRSFPKSWGVPHKVMGGTPVQSWRMFEIFMVMNHGYTIGYLVGGLVAIF